MIVKRGVNGVESVVRTLGAGFLCLMQRAKNVGFYIYLYIWTLVVLVRRIRQTPAVILSVDVHAILAVTMIRSYTPAPLDMVNNP